MYTAAFSLAHLGRPLPDAVRSVVQRFNPSRKARAHQALRPEERLLVDFGTCAWRNYPSRPWQQRELCERAVKVAIEEVTIPFMERHREPIEPPVWADLAPAIKVLCYHEKLLRRGPARCFVVPVAADRFRVAEACQCGAAKSFHDALSKRLRRALGSTPDFWIMVERDQRSGGCLIHGAIDVKELPDETLEKVLTGLTCSEKATLAEGRNLELDRLTIPLAPRKGESVDAARMRGRGSVCATIGLCRAGQRFYAGEASGIRAFQMAYVPSESTRRRRFPWIAVLERRAGEEASPPATSH